MILSILSRDQVAASLMRSCASIGFSRLAVSFARTSSIRMPYWSRAFPARIRCSSDSVGAMATSINWSEIRSAVSLPSFMLRSFIFSVARVIREPTHFTPSRTAALAQACTAAVYQSIKFTIGCVAAPMLDGASHSGNGLVGADFSRPARHRCLGVTDCTFAPYGPAQTESSQGCRPSPCLPMSSELSKQLPKSSLLSSSSYGEDRCEILGGLTPNNFRTTP